MLFYPVGYPKPVRCAKVLLYQIKRYKKVVDHLIEQNGNACYSDEIEEHVSLNAAGTGDGLPGTGQDNENDRDAYFTEAGRLIVDKEKGLLSVCCSGCLRLGLTELPVSWISFVRLEWSDRKKEQNPEKVLMSKEEFEQFIEENI